MWVWTAQEVPELTNQTCLKGTARMRMTGRQEREERGKCVDAGMNVEHPHPRMLIPISRFTAQIMR